MVVCLPKMRMQRMGSRLVGLGGSTILTRPQGAKRGLLVALVHWQRLWSFHPPRSRIHIFHAYPPLHVYDSLSIERNEPKCAKLFPSKSVRLACRLVMHAVSYSLSLLIPAKRLILLLYRGVVHARTRSKRSYLLIPSTSCPFPHAIHLS